MELRHTIHQRKELSMCANESAICPGSIISISQTKNEIIINYQQGMQAKLTFYKENVFRLYLDPTNEFIPHPVPRDPDHDTLILEKDLDYYTNTYGTIVPTVQETTEQYHISTPILTLSISKIDSLMCLKQTGTNQIIWQEATPLSFSEKETIQTLMAKDNEYFYGGGHQNGRFSHKNKSINIKNESNWVSGGVASPSPFYLSCSGYGVMRHTWQDGVYRFHKEATLLHEENRFDAFYFIGDGIPSVLKEYTELTGKPILLPKYAFYLGHADCFNRDSVDNADGSTRLETLMTDAAGMVDSYVKNDMQLGWFLPNDGYGCGYGQTDSFEGDLGNLAEFVSYAKKHGVHTGLWTQSEILPKEVTAPKKGERDITKEVGIAGTVAVKTDVAWVGDGYSMALKAVRQSLEGIEHNSNYRAFVISLNGWAGTQRYATVWTGDETGGLWEYIRFQIPTYLGSGLSGQPNVGSDMDGIYGGKDPIINTRDFQWKAFTPILIDMDGWGTSVKVPWEFGEPYTSINRMYLKLKSQTLPYAYSIARESHLTAIPMVRPMLIEYPEDLYTYGTETCYQYMWGSSLLVAPVYNKKENDGGYRNDIYLPDKDQVWIDYFSGEHYQGGAVYNGFEIPLWKTPVFVKSGAIIPMCPANNSVLELDGTEDRIFDIYPDGESSFTLYDDDGFSKEFKEKDQFCTTEITSSFKDNKLVIQITPAVGTFHGMCKERGTQFIINVTEKPSNLALTIQGNNTALTEVSNLEDCLKQNNTYYYAESYQWNQFATEGSDFAKEQLLSGPKLFVKVAAADITTSTVGLSMDLIPYQPINIIEADLTIPTGMKEDAASTTDACAVLVWDAVTDAEFYDIIKNDVIYTNLLDTCYEDLHVEAETSYSYQVRSRTKGKASPWSQAVTVTTKDDHYRNVPPKITASYTGESHPYYLPESAVDHNDATFFSSYKGAIGQDFTLDMDMVYEIESLVYTPKELKEKGTILCMDILGSIDGFIYKPIIENYTFTYADAEKGYLTDKLITFPSVERIRFIRLHIVESVDDFAAAHALYPYKVEGSIGYPAGDYNSDGLIDEGDLTFLQNYAGIHQTDNVWPHVSRADVNFNGIIDAYDLAFLTSQLDGGIQTKEEGVEGTITCSIPKDSFTSGESFTLTIQGKDLKNVNAFSIELPIDTEAFSFANCESGACKLSSAFAEATNATENMLNYSARREEKESMRLFIAFTNKGEKDRISGDCVLATIPLKALKDTSFNSTMTHGLLVGSDFSVKELI